ncbi:MAG: hypothetical protein QNJ74_13940 [Trichodesmium sp. MO_231.B1]|nr:hypothetical protein [Trichodesmium sp. MO_231.B1]
MKPNTTNILLGFANALLRRSKLQPNLHLYTTYKQLVIITYPDKILLLTFDF